MAVNCDKGVLDTNIYRGLPREGYQAVVNQHISTIALSPLNVLEVIGLDVPPSESDLKRRQAAARKMRDLRDEWVVDPQCYQAALLGCNVQGYTFDEYEMTLDRFISAASISDLSQAPNSLNVVYGRQVRDEAYKQFTDKVKEIRAAYLIDKSFKDRIK